jgi:ribosome-binding protein aMBF1 (putative translation factor)
MAERRRNLADLTPEERAKVEAFRARRATPAARAAEDAARRAVREEFPPAVLDAEVLAALTALRRERERLGLSLTDVADRSGIDRATISKLETGKVANPTLETLRRYAQALGKRLTWSIEELAPTAR